MKKWLKIILIIFIIIVGLIWILVSNHIIYDTNYSKSIEKIVRLGDENKCFDLPDTVSYGLGWSTTFPRAICVRQIAITKKDPSVCDIYLIKHLEDTYAYNDCHERVAYYYNESSFCSDDFCLSKIALKTNNYSICFGIVSDTTKLKATCLKSVARSLENSSICEFIDNSFDRDSCLDAVEKSL